MNIRGSISALFLVIFSLFCFGVLFLSVRGHYGNPMAEELNTRYWKEDGPLELSPERGRFALVYSLVEDQSFVFSLPIARFTTPDLGYANGKYVSLFAPGVSFLVIPGYLIGKFFGSSQVGTFLPISLFAVLNGVLIIKIANILSAHRSAAIMAGIIFLFATPAYAYGVTLYQHHISTFLILSSFYLLFRYRSLWVLPIVWILIACSIPIDYPNLFFMMPLGIYALLRSFSLRTQKEQYVFQIKFGGLFSLISIALPMIFFFWFNAVSYGNPFQLSGTLPTVKAIDEEGNPTFPQDAGTQKNEAFFTDPTKQKKSAVGFFKTRNMIQGLYIHFASPDRGIIYYAPIVFLGVFSFPFLYRKHSSFAQVMIGIIGMNILLYSMWGDPWGGWAFGSRYLIPSYALLSVGIAVVLSVYARNFAILSLVFVLFCYSVGVNTLGAITSNQNPPKVEVLSLEALTGTEQKYTYERNWNFLQAGGIKSFVYTTWLRSSIDPVSYYWALVSAIIGVGSMVLITVFFLGKKRGAV